MKRVGTEYGMAVLGIPAKAPFLKEKEALLGLRQADLTTLPAGTPCRQGHVPQLAWASWLQSIEGRLMLEAFSAR